jgi:hypothetical protein
MFTIDKNVPPPPNARDGRGGRPSKYPFASMEIGDSFLVPYPREARTSDEAVELRRATKNIITSAVSQYKIRTGNRSQKYTTRAEDSGVRVWRIA